MEDGEKESGAPVTVKLVETEFNFVFDDPWKKEDEPWPCDTEAANAISSFLHTQGGLNPVS